MRIAHQRGGHLGALAHALAERADRPVGGVEHARPSPARGRARRGRRRRAGRRCSARADGPSGRPAPPRPRAPGRRSACTWRSRRGSRPSTRTVPWLTPVSPAMARISVVLPAPFGPSRPVTPGPNEQLSSDRATFWPNHTDTPPTTTLGSATNAGSVGTIGVFGAAPSHRRSPLHPAVAVQQDADAGGDDADVEPAGGQRGVVDARSRSCAGRAGRGTRRRAGTAGCASDVDQRSRRAAAAEPSRSPISTPGGDRRHQEQADDRRAGDDPPIGQRGDRHADDGVVQRQQGDRRRAPSRGRRGDR